MSMVRMSHKRIDLGKEKNVGFIIFWGNSLLEGHSVHW